MQGLGGFHPSISGGRPIAAGSVPAKRCLPALLSSFRDRFPDVPVRASAGDSRSVVKEVTRGLAPVRFVKDTAGEVASLVLVQGGREIAARRPPPVAGPTP